MRPATTVRPARSAPRVRRSPLVATLLIVPALALAGCGGTTGGSAGAAAGSSGSSAEAAASTTITGEGALDFTAATVDGKTLDAKTLDGRPTVFWFWTPWCPTCKREAPGVARVAKALEGEVDVVGVAGLGKRPAMQTFVEQGGVGGFTHVDDVDGQVWEHFGVVAQPAFAFVAADGRTEVVPGSLDEKTLMERAEAMVG